MLKTTLLLTALAASFACSVDGAVNRSGPPQPSPEDGAFRIIKFNDAPAMATYLLDAGTKPNTCAFEIRMYKTQGNADPVVLFTTADIIPKTVIDCRPLLQSLSRALMFQGPMPLPRHLKDLSVDVALFGMHESGSPHEGFSPKPPGPWLTSKLFFRNPETEVSFDLNARDQIGGFSFKDEDYAPAVMAAFVNLLSP